MGIRKSDINLVEGKAVIRACPDRYEPNQGCLPQKLMHSGVVFGTIALISEMETSPSAVMELVVQWGFNLDH